MARRVSILLIDDLDGSEAEETVAFGLDGTSYEIDLNAANAASLREALAPYVGPARKATGTRRGGRGAAGKAAQSSNGLSKEDRDAVREWSRTKAAEKQGVEPLGERGRIPIATAAAWQNR